MLGLLERARLDRGLLKSELAREAKLSPTAVYQAFRSGICGVRVARGIASVLGVALADLWLFKGPAHHG